MRALNCGNGAPGNNFVVMMTPRTGGGSGWSGCSLDAHSTLRAAAARRERNCGRAARYAFDSILAKTTMDLPTGLAGVALHERQAARRELVAHDAAGGEHSQLHAWPNRVELGDDVRAEPALALRERVGALGGVGVLSCGATQVLADGLGDLLAVGGVVRARLCSCGVRHAGERRRLAPNASSYGLA
jgi:hypothetical protein